MKKVCLRGTHILELKGRLVSPGFVDGHTHFVNFGLTLQRIDLRNLPSLSECRKRIRESVAGFQPGEWIIGRAWNEHFGAEKRETARRMVS